MVTFVHTSNTLLLLSGIVFHCGAFDVTPGGMRPITPRLNQSPMVTNPKPLRAVAIKPLAQEGSWNAYLDEEKTGFVYYFNTITGERTWKPPSNTFPHIPVDKHVSDNVKALRESYLKKYKSKRNFFATRAFAGLKNWNDAFSEWTKTSNTSPFSSSSTTTTTTAHHYQGEDATPQSTARFASYSPNFNQVIDVIAEPTSNFKARHQSTINETPIDKLLQKKILKQRDDNFVVAKEVFESIDETSTRMISDSLNEIRERIEGTKTFLTGFLAGGVAVTPFVALQDIVMKFSLSQDAIRAFQFDTTFCSVQCALFALMLRFFVPEDQKDNDILTNGIVATSALLRTMMTTPNDHFGWEMKQHLVMGGMESFAMFAAVAAAFDFGCKQNLISRLK